MTRRTTKTIDVAVAFSKNDLSCTVFVLRSPTPIRCRTLSPSLLDNDNDNDKDDDDDDDEQQQV